jgi:hypothetical protein
VDARRSYHPTDFGDAQWARLLAFALERADAFECAIPYRYISCDLERAPLWPRGLETLRADVVDRYISHVRGDRLRDEPAQFLRFHLTPRVLRFVRSIPRLEAWSWKAGMPEDPVLYQGETVLLATESAHGRITVYADSDDLAVLSGAGIRLIEPLGVRAEPWPTP